MKLPGSLTVVGPVVFVGAQAPIARERYRLRRPGLPPEVRAAGEAVLVGGDDQDIVAMDF